MLNRLKNTHPDLDATSITRNNQVLPFLNTVNSIREKGIYTNEITDDINQIDAILKENYIKYKNTNNLNTKKQKIRKLLKQKTRKTCDEVKSYVSNIEYNCLFLPLQDIKYIIGPQSYQEYHYDGKKIYIFGEMHLRRIGQFQEFINDKKKSNNDMTPYNTILFSSLIHILTKNNPDKVYDLHFESGKIIQSNKHKQSNNNINNEFMQYSYSEMADIMKYQFKECLIPKLRKTCEYPNLRTHYTNYRDYIDEKTNLTYYKLIEKLCHDKQLDSIIPSILDSPRLQKQISNIENKNFRIYIIRYFTNNMNDLIVEQKKLINNNEKYNCNKQRGNSFIDKIGLLIMDIYSISRIFRDFKSRNTNTNKNIGKQENIIYYCGENHAERFKDFMSNIKKKETLKIINKKKDDKEPFQWYLELNISETSLVDK